MAKYLLQASYTPEGVKGLIKEGGSSRRKTVGAMIEKMGGKMEAFYYAFGKSDVYVIVDVPDNVTAMALSMAVNQSGAVSLSSVPLITPAEVDRATKKVTKYRAPGK
jgi:uncharacterized protein with GYD domain